VVAQDGAASSVRTAPPPTDSPSPTDAAPPPPPAGPSPQPQTPPPAINPSNLDGRGAAQLAYDTAHHVAVLFSGNDSNGLPSDTWTWDGKQWTQVQTTNSPPPRQGGAFIYDPVRHVSVLFGGATGPGWDGATNDTWTFDGTHWAQQLPKTSPNPRAFPVVAFDSSRGVVVLFGGWTSNGALNDLWTWDGVNWTQQLTSAASAVPSLFPLGLAYRSADSSLLLVGQDTIGTSIYSTVESWALVQNTWSKVTAGGAPPCLDHYGGSAQDVKRGELVFFGGYCTGATVQFDGSTWTATTPNPSPINRGNEAGRPAMAYDPDHQVVLLFGGFASGTYFNDLWTWDGTTWARIG
jgi:hypothetical protein